MNSSEVFSSLYNAMQFPGKVDGDLTGEGNLPQSPPPIDITYHNPTFVSRNSFNILDGHAHSTMSATTAAHPIISNIAIGFILERYIRGLRTSELSSHCCLLRLNWNRLLYGFLYRDRLRLIDIHSRSSLNRLLNRCLLNRSLHRLNRLNNGSLLDRCWCFVSTGDDKS